VGLAQTQRLDATVESRRRLRALYDARLKAIPGIMLPQEGAGVRSVFWMYAIRIGSEFGLGRDALRRELARRGIETRSFFVPIHVQPIYFDQFRGQRFPVAETLCRTGIYLPTSEALGEPDVDWIAAAIADIQRRASAPSLAAWVIATSVEAPGASAPRSRSTQWPNIKRQRSGSGPALASDKVTGRSCASDAHDDSSPRHSRITLDLMRASVPRARRLANMARAPRGRAAGR